MAYQASDSLLFFLGFSRAATRISKPFKTSYADYRCKSKEIELKGDQHGMEFYLSQGKHKARS